MWGLSCTLHDVQQNPWPPPARCQQHPPSNCSKKFSRHCYMSPWKAKSPPREEETGLPELCVFTQNAISTQVSIVVYPILHLTNTYSSFQIQPQSDFLPKVFLDSRIPCRSYILPSPHAPSFLDWSPYPTPGLPTCQSSPLDSNFPTSRKQVYFIFVLPVLSNMPGS